MRLAVVGKGGTGKTTIAGALARLLARRGRRVLALDLDPNPGLAWALGVPPQDHGLPAPMAAHAGPGAPNHAWSLLDGVDAEAEVERLAPAGPDGVRYLSPGKVLGPQFLDDASLFGVRELVRALAPDRWDVVCDIDAATAVSCGRHVVFAERLLLVATPSRVSALTVRRLIDLLAGVPMDVVESMWRDEPDHDGLDPLVRIPFDDAVGAADRRGVALVDHAPGSAAVACLDELAALLVADATRAR